MAMPPFSLHVYFWHKVETKSRVIHFRKYLLHHFCQLELRIGGSAALEALGCFTESHDWNIGPTRPRNHVLLPSEPQTLSTIAHIGGH
eukprot:1178973-Prorocentrum_minimum.AAC.3